MHEVDGVRLGERGPERARDRRDFRRWQRARGQSLPEGRPSHELEDEVRRAGLVLAHVVEGGEAGVREAREGAGRLADPRDEALLRLGGEVGIAAQRLDRHLATQEGVAREEHSSERPLADGHRDLVATDVHAPLLQSLRSLRK